MSQSEYRDIKPNDWIALRQAARRCNERLANLEGYFDTSKRYNTMKMNDHKILNGPLHQKIADGNEFITKGYLSSYEVNNLLRSTSLAGTSSSSSGGSANVKELIRVPSSEVLLMNDYDDVLPEPTGELAYMLEQLDTTDMRPWYVGLYGPDLYMMTVMFSFLGYFPHTERNPNAVNFVLPGGFYSLSDFYGPCVCQSTWTEEMNGTYHTVEPQKSQLGIMQTYMEWPLLRVQPIALAKTWSGPSYPTQPTWLGSRGEWAWYWFNIYGATLESPVWYYISGQFSVIVGIPVP
jgi:hypothetical protein